MLTWFIRRETAHTKCGRHLPALTQKKGIAERALLFTSLPSDLTVEFVLQPQPFPDGRTQLFPASNRVKDTRTSESLHDQVAIADASSFVK